MFLSIDLTKITKNSVPTHKANIFRPSFHFTRDAHVKHIQNKTLRL